MSALLGAPPDLETLRAYYDDYLEALDDVRLEEWPGFFTQDCLYRIIPRENWERGRTLSTMQAESRGMLQDRVTGLLRTQMYAPRIYRRFLSGLRVQARTAEGTRVRQNVLVVQTLLDQPSEIVLCGMSIDLVVHDEERLRFRERVVVMDGEMMRNSLIFPT